MPRNWLERYPYAAAMLQREDDVVAYTPDPPRAVFSMDDVHCTMEGLHLISHDLLSGVIEAITIASQSPFGRMKQYTNVEQTLNKA